MTRATGQSSERAGAACAPKWQSRWRAALRKARAAAACVSRRWPAATTRRSAEVEEAKRSAGSLR
eukprot:12067457-Alexandrium_andersonii.AAC.1